MVSKRNNIPVGRLMKSLKSTVDLSELHNIVDCSNDYVHDRLAKTRFEFVENRIQNAHGPNRTIESQRSLFDHPLGDDAKMQFIFLNRIK